MSVDQMLNRMLHLLHGDKSAVKRLVLGTIDRHPGRPARWYVEKTLWDLQRDRSI